MTVEMTSIAAFTASAFWAWRNHVRRDKIARGEHVRPRRGERREAMRTQLMREARERQEKRAAEYYRE